MQVFDKNGNPVDIPDAQAQEALTSGQYGLPAGTRVPVKTASGKVGTIPVESLPHAVGSGAKLISEQEHAAHMHSSALETILAGAEGAAQGATFDLAEPALVGALAKVSPDTAERLREHFVESKRKNPFIEGTGQALGVLGQALLTEGQGEGLTEAQAEAEAEARAANTTAPYRGPQPEEIAGHLANQGGTIPLSAAEGVSNEAAKQAARADVVDKIGPVGHNLMRRLMEHTITGATYGGLQNVGEAISEDSLSKTHDLSAQKLIGALGEGALFGGLTGAGLGGAAELGSKAMGKLAPAATAAAEDQYFKAMVATADQKAITEADRLPGGRRALARMLANEEAIKLGDKYSDIAPRVDKIWENAGDQLNQFRSTLDKVGAEGPSLRRIVDNFERDMGVTLSKLPSEFRGQRAIADRLKLDLGLVEKQPAYDITGTLEKDSARPRPIASPPVISEGSIPFTRAQEMKQIVSDEVKSWGKPSAYSPETITKDSIYRSMQRAIEDEVERAGDVAAKKMGGSFTEPYKAAKLMYAQASVAKKILANSAKKGTNLTFGPMSIGAAMLGAMLGGGGHTSLSLASMIGHKVARGRGNATAGVLLDKLASLGGIQNAIARTDREVERGVAQIVNPGKRAAPRVKISESTTESRMENVQRILTGQAEPGAHIAAPLETHAPNVSKAVTATATKAVNYLANLLPAPVTINSLQPLKKPTPPNLMEKAKFDRVYTVLNQPHVVLQKCADGTLTRDEVDALKSVHPDLHADMCDKILDKVTSSNKKLPNRTLVSLSILLGQPVTPTMDPRILEQLQGNVPAPLPSGPAHGKKGGGTGSGSGIKPLHTAPKNAGKSVTLTGLNKETLL